MGTLVVLVRSKFANGFKVELAENLLDTSAALYFKEVYIYLSSAERWK